MIDINKIKKLRFYTGASIIDCKRALMKSQGKINLAIKYIETLGEKISQIRKKKSTIEGMIISKISKNNKFGIIIEINCETDFVSKNKNFRNFGKKIVSTTLEKGISDIEEINHIFDNERLNLIRKFNENIIIRRCEFLNGDVLYKYIHRDKVGSLVSMCGNCEENVIKNIAMQIVAYNPKYIRKEDIPNALIVNEKKMYKKIFNESNISKQILEKIITGKIKKLISSISLLEQKFILDSTKTVQQILKEKKLKINNFIRFEVGEIF